MKRERILEILKESEALLQGHFLLTSGKHSNAYVQCAKVLRYPRYAEEILASVVERVKPLDIDMVVGPAMGGIIVAYEIGKQLNKEAIFTERVEGEMQLRRGFEIKKGTRVLIAEDVITTGKSTLEVKKIVESMGGIPIGLACMVDRRTCVEELGFPIFAAIQLKIDTYEADHCPLCSEGDMSLVKPGSRDVKK